MDIYTGRLAIQQRVLPAYRAPFFDLLAESCQDGLSVFSGKPSPEEAIATADELQIADYVPARNLHIGRVSSPFYLCWQNGLLAWLQKWQPDVLIVEANPRYVSTRLAVNWMHVHGRKVLGWGLGVPGGITGEGAAVEALRQPGRQRFLALFDGMIAYSKRGADEYRAQGFPAEKVFVAANAVAHRPQSQPLRPAEFRGRPTVLFVGRMQARKRLDNLLQACAALPPDLQPRLILIGDGPALADFRALAAQIYPLAEFPGARHDAELAPYYEQADLFVLPGTGGLAVQEALAQALPVIAAEGDGTQSDLVRPENGWQVPPGDVDALQAALQEALSDAARLRRMGAESYHIAAEEVNLESMVAAFIAAIHQATG